MNDKTQKTPAPPKTEWVNLEEIIILPQMRKTFVFSEIHSLKENIQKNGLIHLTGIFAATRAEAKEYLDYNNKIHGKRTRLESFGNRHVYKILLFGERRIRALKILKREGSLSDVYPHTKGRIPISTYRSLSIQQATAIQASENTPQLVNRAESAEFHRNWYTAEKESRNGKFSIKKFSEMALKSPKTIAKMLKFHALPDKVKRMVSKGILGYGPACELSRIYESDLASKNECKEWLLIMMSKKWKPKELRLRVSEFIREKVNPKITLFQKSEDQESHETTKALMRIMDKESRIAFMSGKLAFNKILDVFSSLNIDIDTSPLMRKELRDMFRVEVKLFEKVLPHLEKLSGFLENKEIQKAKILTEKITNEIDKIDKYKLPTPIHA